MPPHEYEDDHDTHIKAQLKPTVLVEWDRTRAWHGEKIDISVRTTLVPDGSTVDLKILTTDEQTEIEEIKGLKITTSKVDHKYTIQWKEKAIPADKRDFVVKAFVLDPKAESPPSGKLFVDLVAPPFSF
jgi:hypothetical protein